MLPEGGPNTTLEGIDFRTRFPKKPSKTGKNRTDEKPSKTVMKNHQKPQRKTVKNRTKM